MSEKPLSPSTFAGIAIATMLFVAAFVLALCSIFMPTLAYWH